MSIHGCTVRWERGDQAFAGRRYSRAHAWRFDGGAVVAASSSPHAVKPPWSDPAAVDPEEAFVAAVSSCHMLWFLSLAAERGFVVDSYEDAAEGVLAQVEPGREGITSVQLRPDIVFSGERLPDDAALQDLHAQAHARCYIANSIRSAVRIAGSWRAA